MPEYILGIDLGTTQCCIAIPAREAMQVDGPVELIIDQLERQTTPSVVAEDSDGNIIVGHIAKQRGGMKPKPIFFIKRYMGTDYKEKLLGKNQKSEVISAEILKYLKKTAENYLQASITKAVICVPAYFDLPAKKATQKAGELAGLEVVALLPEPIAAAWAYGLQDNRENLKIFCYDLGGGTFDATVLTKKDGDLDVLAYGGDPYLGGYDFDKLLANHILNILKGRGYKLDLDFSNENDDARYQILLLMAEKYKHKLSDELEVPIIEREIFKDQKDKDQKDRSVDIDMPITRKEFEQLIRGDEVSEFEVLFSGYREKGQAVIKELLINDGMKEEDISEQKINKKIEEIEREIQNKPASIIKTRYLSMISLMKAKLFPQEIDEVIMVGGSSNIPLVHEELQNLFAREPVLVDPNAIVAKGAALKATTFLSGNLPSGLKKLNSPQSSFMNSLNISGQLDEKSLHAPLSKVKLNLSRADGGYESKISPNPENGDFIFEDVELLEEEGSINRFELTVSTSSKKKLLSYEFSITYDPNVVEEGNDIDTDFLTKPIYIETIHGRELVFEAGTKIPVKKSMTKKTTDQSGMIIIPILEGDHPCGDIIIDDLNTSLNVGTPVQIHLEIFKDFTGEGKAVVSADNKEGKITLRIEDVPLIPSIDEMKEDFTILKDSFNEAKENAEADKKLKYGKKGKDLIRDIEKELANEPPVGPKIATLIADLKTTIKKLSERWLPRPSFDDFEKKIVKVYQLDKENKYTKDVKNLQEEGKRAYEEKDLYQWQIVNKNLDKIIADLSEKSIIDIPPEVLAPVLKNDLIKMVRALSEEAQKRGVDTKYSTELKGLKERVEKVDTKSDPVAAIQALQKIYQYEYQPLELKIIGSKICKCGHMNDKANKKCEHCGRPLGLIE